MVSLLLENHKVHPWTKQGGRRIRGWYESGGNLYSDGNLQEPWADCDTPERFSIRLREMNGNYSVILETDAQIFAAVDRITSYPLYYTRDAEGNFCVSDSLALIRKRRPCAMDGQALEEYLACGYILGRKTIYREVFQLQGGEMLIYDKGTGALSIQDYFLHTHSHVSQASPEELCKRLDDTVLRVFRRMTDSIHGRTIALFLSGGYDSRLVAVTLKRLNYPNVVCISLGRGNTRDVPVAQQIARELGYPLIWVKVDRAYWRKLRKTGAVDAWLSQRAKHCAMPYFQGLVLKDLIDSGKLPRDCVGLTGNSGDAIEGNDVTHRFLPGKLYSAHEVAEAICFNHFMLNGVKEGRKLLAGFDLAPYSAICGKKERFTDEEAEEIVEFFNWRERQCKHVVNDIRNYDDVLGVEWRLPLWDQEFVDFWLSVPYHLRYDRKLYYQYVAHEALPTANNPTLIRKGIDAAKKRMGDAALWMYLPKALWNYFISTSYYFALYGLLTFSELCAVLRTTKGYRDPHFEGLCRLFLKYF